LITIKVDGWILIYKVFHGNPGLLLYGGELDAFVLEKLFGLYNIEQCSIFLLELELIILRRHRMAIASLGTAHEDMALS
jgi:hypothetical protein